MKAFIIILYFFKTSSSIPLRKENEISYSIESYPSSLETRIVDEEIDRSFRIWSKYTSLRFKRKSRNADVEISFVSDDHNDRFPFTRNGESVAHSFTLEGKNYIHFNNYVDWTVNKTEEIDLYEVAAHEIGHILGLKHSNNIRSLMYDTFLPEYRHSEELSQDDIEAIQALYS